MYDGNSPILGNGIASAADIQAWFEANAERGAGYVGLSPVPPPSDIGVAIMEYAGQWGPNADIIAGQIAHESAFWQSQIVRDKNNPSGLGAENDDAYVKAVRFTTPVNGIRATVAHLCTYAVGDGPWSQYDPRYQAVKQAGYLGVAHVLNDLNGRWAYPGTDYGEQVAAHANDLLAHAQGTPGGTMTGRDDRFAWKPDTTEFGYPSPGTHGRNGYACELFILHYTAGRDSEEQLHGDHSSSSHYLTNTDMTPRDQFVDEADAAWTAGSMEYNCRGINLEAEKLVSDPWDDALVRELAKTSAPILARNNLPPVYLGKNAPPGTRGMIGHHDVPNPIPPSDPKYCGPWGGSNCHQDPGEGTPSSGPAFPWSDFERYLVAEMNSAPPPANEVTFSEVPYKIVLGFADFWNNINPGLRLYILGFPVSDERAVTTIPGVASMQPFERGYLVWLPGQNPEIVVATRELQRRLEAL